MTCDECKFWAEFPRNPARGECRRNAPVVFLADIPDTGDPAVRRRASWPSTGEADWCGEFAPKSDRKGFV